MNSNKINAKMLAKMFLAGAKNLEANKEWINELNVFPVPDGDTGTNMTLTIMSAAKEVVNLQDEDMMTICKAISSGSLRGARETPVLFFPSYSVDSRRLSVNMKKSISRHWQLQPRRPWNLLTRQL